MGRRHRLHKAAAAQRLPFFELLEDRLMLSHNPAIVFETYDSRDTRELWVMNADGSNQAMLLTRTATEANYNPFFASWEPNPHPHVPGTEGRLALQNCTDPYNECSIFLTEVSTGENGVQASDPTPLASDARQPAWSPRGDLIAYIGLEDSATDTEGIYAIDASGTETPTALVQNLRIPGKSSGELAAPAWNRDATRIAYRWWDEANNQNHISIKELQYDDDGNLKDVNDDGVADGLTYVINTPSRAQGIDWSHNSDMLAYKIRAGSGDPLRGIHVVQLEPGGPDQNPLVVASDTVLSDTTSAESPTWSPESDNELVFFTRRGESGSGKRKIALLDLTTDEKTILAEHKGGHLYNPDWRAFQFVVGNHPPIANSDNYSTQVDTTLNMAAPGVLHNDNDVDGDVISVDAWSGPTTNGGQVVLHNDGSFTYTPPTGFTGSDTFSYVVTDGVLNSNPATVSVDVSGADSFTALYVAGITFAPHPTRAGMYQAIFEIHADDNGDDIAGNDSGVADVAITVNFAGKAYSGTTDSDGKFTTRWVRLKTGNTYYANVVDLVLADYAWNPFDDLLNQEDDSDKDGLPDAEIIVNWP